MNNKTKLAAVAQPPRTLRDEFAVAALVVIIARHPLGEAFDYFADGIVAYQCADGALKARTAPWPPTQNKVTKG